MDRSIPDVLSTAAVSGLLMLTRQRLYQLEADGQIKRSAPDVWRTEDVVQGYIRFLRDHSRVNRSASDNRLREARAIEVEVRTAERLGKFVAVEEFDAMIDLIVGVFRTELSGLPARITRDLALRRSIEREIHGLLERVADTAEANAARLDRARSA